MDTQTLVVLVLAGLMGYLLYDTYFNAEVDYVEASDGNKYLVRDMPDKKEAANLLAQVRARSERLIEHLKKAKPEDPRTIQLFTNFRADKLSEGGDNAKYTSYSVNKGERIIFCLRARDGTNKLADINTVMFVAIHELGHLCTTDIGHTKMFWDNFRWLLEDSLDIGIYVKDDYKNNPQSYCGIEITSSPLDK